MMRKFISILKKIDTKLDEIFNWLVIIISPLIIVEAMISFYGDIRRSNTIYDVIIPTIVWVITVGIYGALLYMCIKDQRKNSIEQ